MQTKTNMIAANLMILSALLVSLGGLLIQKLSAQLNFEPLLFLRFFAPCLLLSCLGLITNQNFYNLQNIKLHFIRAIFIVTSQFCIFYCLIHDSIFFSILLWNTNVLFIPLLSRMIFKEQTPLKAWLSIGIGFLGVLCVINPKFSNINALALIGLAGGLFNACSQVVFYKAAQEQNEFTVTFFMLFFSSIICASLCIAFSANTSLNQSFHALNNSAIWILLSALSILVVMNQLLRSHTYRKTTNLALISPLMYCSIVFSAILDWIFYHRTPNLMSIIGAIIVIVAAAMVGLCKTKSSPQNIERASTATAI